MNNYERLVEMTTELELVDTLQCKVCGCVTIVNEDGYRIYLDRYTFSKEQEHECECHELTAKHVETGEKEEKVSSIHINPDGTWGDDFIEVDTSKWHEGDFTTLDTCYYEGARFDLAQALTAYAEAGRPALEQVDKDGEPVDWADVVTNWWYDHQ